MSVCKMRLASGTEVGRRETVEVVSLEAFKLAVIVVEDV